MTAHPSGIDGPRGQALWHRADRVLPGGAVYLSRSADMAGRGVLPGFVQSASGCRITDVDGRSYIDFLGANGPNLLGYRHPEIEAAARAQADESTSASFFPPALVEVVESLLARYQAMSWGLVGKNGSEAVSLATRVARQASQRPELVAFRAAYHGSSAELAGGPPPGPLADLTARVHRLPWNDADRLRDLVAARPDAIAAIVLNPLDQNPRQRTREPSRDFVAAVREVRQRHGTLVVLDDVRHGFRLHPRGSEHLLGIEPDLICLGKALGNGHAISALLGTASLRRSVRKILYTSTYVFEAPPMRAALRMLEIYDRDRVFERITAAGNRLRNGLLDAARDAGHRVNISGPAAMPTLLFESDPDFSRQLTFARRAAELGAIFHPALNWNLSLAHQPADIDEALRIASRAFRETPDAAS